MPIADSTSSFKRGMADTTHPSLVRRHPVWTGVLAGVMVLAIALLVLLANPAWLRGPLERFVAAQLHRELGIGELHLRWNGQPTLVLNDVVLGNLAGASEPQMARVRSMEMTLSLLDLLRGHVVIPKVGMTDLDLLLERLPDGRKNWVVGNEDKSKQEKPRSRLRLGSVSLTSGRVRYLDRTIPIEMTVEARALETATGKMPRSDDTPARNSRYGLAYEISGHYRGNAFSGHAQSGGVVSLADSGDPFPLQLDLTAGETRLQMEGTVADATQLSGIDMRMQMSGPTLANIYPLLLLPLPASPPYRLQGRLAPRRSALCTRRTRRTHRFDRPRGRRQLPDARAQAAAHGAVAQQAARHQRPRTAGRHRDQESHAQAAQPAGAFQSRRGGANRCAHAR